MNDTEKQECKNVLGTEEGVTMEDYFNWVSSHTNKSASDLKEDFKDFYPDITDWSF